MPPLYANRSGGPVALHHLYEVWSHPSDSRSNYSRARSCRRIARFAVFVDCSSDSSLQSQHSALTVAARPRAGIQSPCPACEGGFAAAPSCDHSPQPTIFPAISITYQQPAHKPPSHGCIMAPHEPQRPVSIRSPVRNTSDFSI